MRRIGNCNFGRKHFADTAAGNSGAGYHNEHHADHQEAEHNLHGVLHECHHVAHLQCSGGDLLAANPDNKQCKHIHYQVHGGHHKGHNAVDKQVVFVEVEVGFVKASFFKFLGAESTHDHKAGQIFTRNKI